MKCDDYKIHFMEFLYNEMEPGDEAELKEHLKICDACRQEYEALSKTSVLLHGWPDEEPGAGFVFVRESAGLLSGLRDLIWPAGAPLGRKLVAGFSTAAVAALVVAALLNFEFSKEGDRMNVRFGLMPRPTTASPPSVDAQLVQQLREENLQLINQVLLANRQQQQQEVTRTLAQFAREVERQRQSDLLLVGRGFERVQELNDSRFQRTNEVLNSLIHTAAYQSQE